MVEEEGWAALMVDASYSLHLWSHVKWVQMRIASGMWTRMAPGTTASTAHTWPSAAGTASIATAAWTAARSSWRRSRSAACSSSSGVTLCPAPASFVRFIDKTLCLFSNPAERLMVWGGCKGRDWGAAGNLILKMPLFPILYSPTTIAGIASSILLFVAIIATMVCCFMCSCCYLYQRRQQRGGTPYDGKTSRRPAAGIGCLWRVPRHSITSLHHAALCPKWRLSAPSPGFRSR